MLICLKDMLATAKNEHFAVGAFNTTDLNLVRAVIEEAEATKTPAILQFAPGEFNFATPEFFAYVTLRMRNSDVPLALHLDHGKTIEDCLRAIQAGFTSVMFAGSQMEYDQNVECTRRVVEAAHGAGVSVEGEIGTIGETEDYLNGTVRDMVYTSPELARRFVEDTGVDALAVSIGTVHGILPKGYVPKLQLGLLKELAAAVPVPLVLHGGSGTPHDEVAAACRTGIHKVNISSEFKHAYYQSVREFVTNHPTLVSPTLVLKDAVQEVRNVAGTKMQVLGSTGKSHCYRKY